MPTSFTVTWTTDEPSDSHLEYGATATYGSTASDAALVTAHSLTVTGLPASTLYHFRAGSTDACGNGPSWSSDGTVTTAAVSTTLDVGGYTLTQANSTQTYTLPQGTTVPAGGYVVIARNVDKAAFETAWGVTLGPDVVFLNSGEKAPMINGGETYTLTNAVGAVLDGPTIALPATFQSVRRNDPCLAAGSTGSWTAGPLASANPGSGAGPGCGTGLVINEFSDAAAFANEFVELHWDSPAAAPIVTTTRGDGRHDDGCHAEWNRQPERGRHERLLRVGPHDGVRPDDDAGSDGLGLVGRRAVGEPDRPRGVLDVPLPGHGDELGRDDERLGPVVLDGLSRSDRDDDRRDGRHDRRARR